MQINWGNIVYLHLEPVMNRLTVGRVKPYFNLHKLCACDAIYIMIPQRGWIWTPPLDWTPLLYSVRYMGLGWNI